MNGRTFGGIEHPEMQRRFIGDFAHLAAERIYFLDQLSLASPPMAGLQDISAIESRINIKKQCRTAHARRCQGCFATGMAAAITIMSYLLLNDSSLRSI